MSEKITPLKSALLPVTIAERLLVHVQVMKNDIAALEEMIRAQIPESGEKDAGQPNLIWDPDQKKMRPVKDPVKFSTSGIKKVNY